MRDVEIRVALFDEPIITDDRNAPFVRGFNDRSWLDGFGHPRSESMHIVERFRRSNFGHMDIEVTIDDSKMYTRPFTVKFPARLLPDTDTLESICAENEKDRPHLDK